MTYSQFNIKTYLESWLRVSGDFSLSWSEFQDRMRLECHKCKAMLTVPKPEDETKIDWSVQEWVKTHGFNGAHTGQMLESMLNSPEWANANEIIKAIKAPPAWSAPPEPKRVNAHIAKGRRFR